MLDINKTTFQSGHRNNSLQQTLKTLRSSKAKQQNLSCSAMDIRAQETDYLH